MPIRPPPRTEHLLPGRRLSLQLAGASALAWLSGCGGGDPALAPASATAAVDEPRRRALGGVDSGGTGSPDAAFFSAALSSASPLTLAGVTLDVGGAAFTDGDGTVLSAADMAPGMTAQVQALWSAATPDQARALSVRTGEQLRGPLQQLDLTAGRLVVLEQRVRCTATTQFESGLGGLAGLAGGRLLRVWGALDVAAGEVVATRIGTADGGLAYVVRGVLTRADAGARQLAIGGLTVTADVPPDCRVGDIVRARLIPRAEGGVDVLELRRDPLVLPASGAAELEGRVTAVVSATLFAIDGVPVDAALAAWSGPPPTLGARAAAAGRADQGVLRAAEASVAAEALFELEGSLGRVDAAARTFDLRGVTVSWDATTRFEGGDPRSLVPRRKVSVKGRLSADRLRLQAVRIHVEA